MVTRRSGGALVLPLLVLSLLGAAGAVGQTGFGDRVGADSLAAAPGTVAAGLRGEIDLEKSQDGQIVCKDGFTATTVGPGDFLYLTANLPVDVYIVEVDESSLFCEITPRLSWIKPSD